jgi:hypothetical protein
MTREETSLETLWSKNMGTMDKVHIRDRSNTAPSLKTFRDERSRNLNHAAAKLDLLHEMIIIMIIIAKIIKPAVLWSYYVPNIILFNSLLLMCCINSQKANYGCSTREDKILNITK